MGRGPGAGSSAWPGLMLAWATLASAEPPPPVQAQYQQGADSYRKGSL